MKSRRSESCIVFQNAAIVVVVVVVCYLCSMEANAAPRNNRNHMAQRGNFNHDNDGNYDNQPYGADQRPVGSGEPQVDSDESNQSEINDESGAVDPEFASLTDDGSPESAASNLEGEEMDELSPASANLPDERANRNLWPTGGNVDTNDDAAGEPRGQDSNIDNAKIRLTASDMSTAAGHHYHGHGVHGWLKMGAHTGKKGAFGWHDKHPVGGKGRR